MNYHAKLFMLSIAVLLIKVRKVYSSVGTASIPKVAVIGGGIGGASACYFLRELFGPKGVTLDLYEPSSIGGRLAVVKMGDGSYEAGGSVIHPRNKYMVEFAKRFDLNHTTSNDETMGLYNGKKYVFQDSTSGMVTLWRLFWRYGPLNLWHFHTMITELLAKFDRIYDLQDRGNAYTTVEKLLSAMDPHFVELTQKKASDVLMEEGFTKTFINEIGLAAARVNYGQTMEINGLVGAIALSASSDLWSVYGGNYRLAEEALSHAVASIIKSPAYRVTMEGNGYSVLSETLDEDKNRIRQEKSYDIVIVTAPQTKDLASIKFEGFPKSIDNFPGHYHQTVATFVQGDINPKYFHFDNPNEALDCVITIDTKMKYNSVCKNRPVNDDQSDDKLGKVWKIFSQKPLENAELDKMFLVRNLTQVIDWHAYPHYTPPEQLGSFQLHDRLYYTSAIEWGGSAMEMSAIAGKNAALLAYNQWFQHDHLIDKEIPQAGQTEL